MRKGRRSGWWGHMDALSLNPLRKVQPTSSTVDGGWWNMADIIHSHPVNHHQFHNARTMVIWEWTYPIQTWTKEYLGWDAFRFLLSPSLYFHWTNFCGPQALRLLQNELWSNNRKTLNLVQCYKKRFSNHLILILHHLYLQNLTYNLLLKVLNLKCNWWKTKQANLKQ